MQGLLLINKPEGLTSFGVVAKIKWLLNTKRVGHTGTLDPMATGVLPVLVGRPTVLCGHLLDADKEYIADIKLGIITDTLDKTGEVIEQHSVNIKREQVEAVLSSFTGKQLQTPPMYSAIKKDGVRLYELAREGKEIERSAREIEIHELELLDFNEDEFKIRVKCSKGTYIRSLADDIGKALGTGAILTALVRTKTAGFDIKECVSLDALTKENIIEYICSAERAVVNYPVCSVSEKQAMRFANGGELSLDRLRLNPLPNEGDILRIKCADKLLGLGRVASDVVKIECLTWHASDEYECRLMKKYAIALGTFDGLHLGHMAVLRNIQKEGYSPLILTFDTPPKMRDANKYGLILTIEDKYNLFSSMEIEAVSLDFESVKNLSPLEFLNQLVEKYHPSLIASGFNFRFGRGAAGDDNLLNAFCIENGIKYIAESPVMEGDLPISSTRIRNAISNGEVDLASKMLGRHFSFTSTVIYGDQRGRKIGYPTMNQAYPLELVAPRFGVYASITEIDGKRYKSITNIGKRPTFETDYIISETHLFEYNFNAYGKNARVFLTKFIRDEVKFSGIDELKKAIAEDTKKAALDL